MAAVLKANESFNLTAIKDEETFVEKMIFDSALLLNNQDFAGVDILDIGAGAGFPSVVVSILSPKTHIIALDSTAKKVGFIKEYAEKNNLNITGISARAEDFAKANREKFMVVTARAVASLRILIELAKPAIKAGISSKWISKNAGKIGKENLRNGTVYKMIEMAAKTAVRAINFVVIGLPLKNNLATSLANTITMNTKTIIKRTLS